MPEVGGCASGGIQHSPVMGTVLSWPEVHGLSCGLLPSILGTFHMSECGSLAFLAVLLVT